MKSFRIIALTPVGLPDPAIAVAASRAGELGTLNLEFVTDLRSASEAIAATERALTRPFGVRLAGYEPEFSSAVCSNLPDLVDTVILSVGEEEGLFGLVGILRTAGKRVLLEVSSDAEAAVALKLGVDGVIAKGHEAGGWCGEETTFVLLQRLRGLGLPVLAQGGIGLHSVAACMVAGAEGVVLDAQLLLTRESSLPHVVKQALSRMDGTETVQLGASLGGPFRLFAQVGLTPLEALCRVEQDLLQGSANPADVTLRWRREIRRHCGWDAPERSAWPIGQDISFAKSLADRFVTVSGVISAMQTAVGEYLAVVRAKSPLAENAPLAVAHGTSYPIVQGPMTRVSDRAEFALEIAKGGALPFVALALMRGAEAESLLAETKALLGERPWGVGILGFVPPELRNEQFDAVRTHNPKFALIAGGRPDQSQALEREGIATYLHVPSTGLLRLFVRQGARSFVFEGRECGGHVGPLSSFVLWDSMITALLSELPAQDLARCRVLFAGGIHDGISAAMVAAMAAPLVDKGVSIGMLMGTAYLFTKEAVSSGAILQGFQDEAVKCNQTVLLESGPGHATRCANTQFARMFQEEKQRLTKQGKPAEEIRNVLEELNIGRLRIASKGIDRNPAYERGSGVSKFVEVGPAEQAQGGMYMLGQVAAVHSDVCSIEQLHRDIAEGGSQALDNPLSFLEVASSEPAPPMPSEVAIIGMSTILPGARRVSDYWTNLVNNAYSITEIPKERWDWSLYFDSDPNAKDKIYSKWGGFIDPVEFDPVEYGMPPSSLRSVDPMHLLALQTAREALEDAGYWTRPFDRTRTSVILGASGGIGELGGAYLLRSSLPLVLGETAADVIAAENGALPEWSEDSFAGLLLNVAAGRIANRFDLGGVNYVVDAACASSLAATHQAVRELETGSSDMVIVGGVDTTQNPFGYLCFSKTRALSPTGSPRTFDAAGDGIVISEGITMLVLKRLADAERDGDRIYAVIQGVGGASDGKAKGMTAPRPEGQILALDRAYKKAGFSPVTVGLFEAHGTGTVVGDQTEAEALSRFLTGAGALRSSAAVGSVKSMIGHTKATAGVAGLAKIALALYQKVLPPTHGVTNPNPKAGFGDGPLYVNTEVRPWMHGLDDHPRRAGVSAFGFGGTNFHAVLEEYTADVRPPEQLATWPSELFLFSAESRGKLLGDIGNLKRSLESDPTQRLCDLSLSRWSKCSRESQGERCRLAIVASSIKDLSDKLVQAEQRLGRDESAAFEYPGGLHYDQGPTRSDAEVAFLFPGQGSQYPGMLRELALYFDEVREAFERGDAWLAARIPQGLSSFVFPVPAFSGEEKDRQQDELTRTNIAQPAIGAASVALYRLLGRLGLRPGSVAGHSYGEYVALFAAEVFGEKDLALISEARGRSIIEAASGDLGTMLAVMAGADETAEALSELTDAWLANYNSPRQTILSGTVDGVAAAATVLRGKGLETRTIPVGCAFHSPLVAPAKNTLAHFLSGIGFSSPKRHVFSNNLADRYPPDPESIREILCEHLVNPVRFTDEVEAMYRAGARVFVEVGPNNKLTSLVKQNLDSRPHAAIALDVPNQSGLVRLQQALAQLFVKGVALSIDRFFETRRMQMPKSVDASQSGANATSTTAWLVDGGRAWPARSDSPPRLRPLSVELIGEAGSAVRSGIASVMPTAGVTDSGAIQRNPMSRMFPADSPPPASGPVFSGQTPGYLHPERSSVSSSPTASPAMPATNLPEIAQVMSQFQSLMGTFLETQSNVMLAYFGGKPGGLAPDFPTRLDIAASMLGSDRAGHDLPQATARSSVGESATGYQSNTQDREPKSEPRDSEAAKRSSANAVAARLDEVQTTSRLLDIVSERTGYPPEMLDLDLDLEADLGIDSIKRVEILGTFQQSFAGAELVGAEGLMERLAAAKTLRAIIEQVTAQSAAASAPAEAVSGGPQQPAPTPAQALDEGQLRSRLLDIVSERTGYPPEMLDLDLDLEADLGIDSIKRVEILGTFQHSFAGTEVVAAEGLMERLAAAKTLRAIIERVAEQRDSTAGQASDPGNMEDDGEKPPFSVAGGVDKPPSQEESRIGRYRFEPVETPLAGAQRPLAPNRIVLVTDDGGGIAFGLTKELRARGLKVVLVQPDQRVRDAGDGCFTADFRSSASVAELIDVLRKQVGPIGAVVHLLPLRSSGTFSEIDFAGWRDRLRLEVKSLFYLAKATAVDLREAGANGGACLLSATQIGSAFTGTSKVAPHLPGQKGLNGLVKTLALEWPEVRAKAVALDPDDAPEILVRQLLAEMLEGDELVEVAYGGGRRVSLTLRSTPSEGSGASKPGIGSSSVILITGGARGITAQAGCRLAELYQPTLLLVGRSPLPDTEESGDTAGIAVPKDLKAALMKRMRERGEQVAPALVEKAYARLNAEREIRENLSMMERLGARVHYYSADVRNWDEFGALIDRIYESFGRLDGVIHGAGIIEDKLVVEKTPESFDRTFDTKADSAFILAKMLRPDALKFLVFFSSVSGSFGNLGQADYAAANEVLNMLAHVLDQAWPARVVSINWGPWDTAGMVSPELRKQFEERGVELIPPAVGLRMLVDELACGHKGESQVIVGGAGWRAPAARRSALPRTLPLIGQTVPTRVNGLFELVREFAVATDLYLRDHRIDGKPVLPLAVATELMAETVAAAWPEHEVAAVTDLYMLKGLVLDEGASSVRVVLTPQPIDAQGHQSVAIEVTGLSEPYRVHYRATVELSRHLPSPPTIRPLSLNEKPLGLDVSEVYRNWLFHGPLFQGIVRVEQIGPEGVRAVLMSSDPAHYFAGTTQGAWLIDPLMLDSGLQLLILWSREHWDMTTLPSRFRAYRRFGSPEGQSVQCEVKIRPETACQTIHTDIIFRNARGDVIGILEDMEGSSSKALNRLVGEAAKTDVRRQGSV